MPWFLLEGFFIVLIITVYLTQIALPIWLDRPIFPALRWRKVVKDLAEVRENKELSAARKHVDKSAATLLDLMTIQVAKSVGLTKD